MTNKKRLVVEIPIDLHRRIKQIAVKYNMSMGSYLVHRMILPVILKENEIDNSEDIDMGLYKFGHSKKRS